MFLARRLAQAALVLWLLVTAMFVALQWLPGGPTAFLADPEFESPERITQIERNLGLDRPLLVQYEGYLAGLLHGELGWSPHQNAPVARLIGERLGPSLLLMATAFTLALVVGTAWGTLAAWHARGPVGALLDAVPVLAVTAPGFWIGLLLIYVLAIELRLLPSGGMLPPGSEASPWLVLRHLILPTVVLALPWVGTFALYTRSSLRAILVSDYLRTAWAKGLADRGVLWQHALPNAAIPLVTMAGISIPHLLGNAVVVEQLFAWPGIGRLAVESLLRRDYPVMLGIVLVVGLAAILANLVADVVYHLVDPGVRVE